jgi:hypothetical protein
MKLLPEIVARLAQNSDTDDLNAAAQIKNSSNGVTLDVSLEVLAHLGALTRNPCQFTAPAWCLGRGPQVKAGSLQAKMEPVRQHPPSLSKGILPHIFEQKPIFDHPSS